MNNFDNHLPLKENKAGFTLIEVMLVSIISVVVIGAAVGAFIMGLKTWQAARIKNELNINLELSMESIRKDLRLSSVGVGLMAFYPADAAEYTAISIPLSDDLLPAGNPDGLLDRDASGNIVWNKTVIYHVRKGSPDQLIRTVYSPRNTSATPADFYQQLVDVVASEDASDLADAALTGESVSSRTIFENLVDLKFRPPDALYDCYSSYRKVGDTYNWGSMVLDSGTHKLRFEVVGKNTNSSGYNIEVDKVHLSASASPREGESFIPSNVHPKSPYFAHSVSGGVASAQEMTSVSPSWSDNCEIKLASTGLHSSVTFDIYNDLWCDTGFGGSAISSNCSVKYDTNFVSTAPYAVAPNIPDMSVSMDKGIAWTASRCGEDVIPPIAYNSLTSVTNIIYGGTNYANMSISLNGQWAKLYFERADGYSLCLTNVAIMDPVSGVSSNVTFNGGDNYVQMPTDGPMTTNSDWIPMWNIDKNSNYVVRLETLAVQGDDDYDLFIGGSTGFRFVENTGDAENPAWANGAVKPWQSVLPGGTIMSPEFVDIDGDGDQDLFVGKWGSGCDIEFWENQGDSRYPDMKHISDGWNTYTMGGVSGPAATPYRPYPAFTDIDSDGDYDLFVGEIDGRIKFFENTGTVNVAQWAPPDSFWQGIQVWKDNIPDIPIDSYQYASPAFVDIDADGDKDLIIGRYRPGTLVMYENVGNFTNPVMVLTNSNYTGITGGSDFYSPKFVDIDKDGDYDMFVGCDSWAKGLSFRENIGTPANAVWGAESNLYAGLTSADIGNYIVPAFANIDQYLMTTNVPASWRNTDTNIAAFSIINGALSDDLVALSAIEVGYPQKAVFRSRIFDTHNEAPIYNMLKWTHYEDLANHADIDIRVRASDMSNMADLTDLDWLTAKASDFGHFQRCDDPNSLSSLPHKRYVQYEARIMCNGNDMHTNSASAVLRDVTIDWPAETGLVDLQSTMGLGPDCGIVQASVDGQSFIKGIQIEMSIFKAGRLGTNEVSGILEVRPLNTGR